MLKTYQTPYGVTYSIEPLGMEYSLFCIKNEIKKVRGKEEKVAKKQSYFRGDFDECLKYLESIEKDFRDMEGVA